MSFAQTLRDKARALKRETLALYVAMRDPRTPLLAKVCASIVVAYALSPIDLIPDFIPVLGFLDDVILVPLGIALCIRLIPDAVLADARVQAASLSQKPVNHVAAAVIVLVWVGAALLFSWWFYRTVLGNQA